MFLNSHWPVDDEGHHNVHISDVFLQVRVGQVQLCAPEKHQRKNKDQTHCKFEEPLISSAHFGLTLIPQKQIIRRRKRHESLIVIGRLHCHHTSEKSGSSVLSCSSSHWSIALRDVNTCTTPSTILQP